MEENRNITAGLIVTRSIVEKASLGTSLVMMSVMGSFGNIIVLYAFAYKKKLIRNPSNIFILSLALSNFLTSFIVMPIHMFELMMPQLFSHSGLFCDIAAVSSYPFVIVANFTLVALSVDRYLAVSRPTEYKSQVTPKRACQFVIVIWSYVLILTITLRLLIVPKFSWTSYDCGLNWRARGLIFLGCAFAVNLFIPLGAIIILNVLIWKHVRTRRNIFTDSWALRRTSTKQKLDIRNKEMERRVVRMVTCIIITCIICWIPYFVTRLLVLLDIKLPGWTHSLAVWFLHLTSPLNPIIYTAFKKDFLAVFLKMVPCFDTRIQDIKETTF